MKKTILLFFAVTTLFGLSGQERIEQIYSMYGEHSIIREVSQTKWVVYSNSEALMFSLVIDGNSSADVIRLPVEFDSVSDFTIFQNAVFFCGKRNGVPVMGHFELSPFIGTTVHYSEMTGVDRLTAIKTLDSDLWPPKSTPRHVLMIGEKDDIGIFVDALFTGSSWDTYYVTLLTKDHQAVLHDDIDILDDYVVLSSHETDVFFIQTNRELIPVLGQGFVWYIKKPTPQYAPLLTTATYYPIPNVPLFTPVKLTACEGNTCVAAALAYMKIDNEAFPGIHVYGFNEINNSHAIRIVSDIKNKKLMDLCYDKSLKSTEIFLQYNNNSISESRIYTLTQNSYPLGTATGHSYVGHKINSLITQTNNSGWLIGSGIEVNDLSYLKLYRYKSTAWGNCTNILYRDLEDIEKIQFKDGSKFFKELIHADYICYPYDKNLDISIICE